jgi:hypothetical protein
MRSSGHAMWYPFLIIAFLFGIQVGKQRESEKPVSQTCDNKAADAESPKAAKVEPQKPAAERESSKPVKAEKVEEQKFLSVKKGEVFKLSNGSPLTISGQPVRFGGIDEYQMVVIEYEEEHEFRGRKVRNPIILPIKIKDNVAKVGPHVLRIVSLTDDECRYTLDKK